MIIRTISRLSRFLIFRNVEIAAAEIGLLANYSQKNFIFTCNSYGKMILDSFERFVCYTELNPLFRKVLEFFRRHDPATLADGRYEIDGQSVYMVLGENVLKNESEALLEAHDRYIDIQYVIRGRENFGWRDRSKCLAPRSEMDAERDILFFDDRPSTFVGVTAGQFVIFFPYDAHAPLIGEGCDRKCIVKVLVHR